MYKSLQKKKLNQKYKILILFQSKRRIIFIQNKICVILFHKVRKYIMEEKTKNLNFQVLRKKKNLKYIIKKSKSSLRNDRNYLSLSSKNQESCLNIHEKKENQKRELINIPSINDRKKDIKLRKYSKLYEFEERKSQNVRPVKRNISNLKKRQEESQAYLKEIGNIISKGIQLGRLKTVRMKKIIETENVMERKYSKLKEHSDSIILGSPIYKLAQQVEGNYKDELRQMWMRTDK